MKEDLENKIMNDIKSGRVKLRSKYIFLAEKLGLQSGLVFTILLAILFFNLILFYMKETDNLVYLTFGPNGFLAFLESFPYLLVITFIAIVFLLGFLIKKTDFSYKNSFGKIAICLISLIIIAGTFLTFTNVNNELKRHRPFFMDPFFEHRPFLKNGITGTIMKKDSDGFILNTSKGLEYINMGNVHEQGFKENDFVIIIGSRGGEDFFAKDMKIVDDPNKMLFTRSRLPNKECMDNCINQNNFSHDCFDKCKNEIF